MKEMAKENKTLILMIVLGTLFIGSTLSVIVYYVFGSRAVAFFITVLAIPLGAICSLLALMFYKAIVRPE